MSNLLCKLAPHQNHEIDLSNANHLAIIDCMWVHPDQILRLHACKGLRIGWKRALLHQEATNFQVSLIITFTTSQSPAQMMMISMSCAPPHDQCQTTLRFSSPLSAPSPPTPGVCFSFPPAQYPGPAPGLAGGPVAVKEHSSLSQAAARMTPAHALSVQVIIHVEQLLENNRQLVSEPASISSKCCTLTLIFMTCPGK